MSKSDPPTPPSPTATAGAQTASNVSTAVANAFLNNTNQTTPLGALNYNVTDQYNFTDPTTGQTYQIPRFTAAQTLSPQEASIQSQNEAAKYNLAGLSANESGQLASLLGTPFSIAGAPAASDPNLLLAAGQPRYGADNSGLPVMGFNPSGEPTYGFDPAGAITKTYGPADDFSSDRARVEESLYGRLNPQLALEQQHIEQQLADQGIRYGSAAYTNAMDSYNRQANDARLAVTQTAGQEQQRMMDMAAKRAGFENAAQMQEFQQAQARGEFFNQAQQQRYGQDIGRGQFYNAAQQGLFSQNMLGSQFYNSAVAQQQAQYQALANAQNAARQQFLSEQYSLRGQPINEISALLSGSQVAQPAFMQTPQSQIPTTDVAGLINQNFNQQFGNFQQQNLQQQQLIGGLFGLGAGALRGGILSDRRAKKDIHRVGTVFASTPHAVADVDSDEPGGDNVKKLPIYNYAYKGDPESTRHIGPMAQDVERIDPHAVRMIGGRKHVDARVMGSILRAA